MGSAGRKDAWGGEGEEGKRTEEGWPESVERKKAKEGEREGGRGKKEGGRQ